MRKRRLGEIGGLLQGTCLKIKVLSWPWLIFHHTPKLKMWESSLICQIVLAQKDGCHIGFAKGQGSRPAGRGKTIKDCWSHQMPCKNTLFKGHLLQMEFLRCNTKWRWHDLKCNIWNGFGILIRHTFGPIWILQRYKQNIPPHTYIPYLSLKSL